MPNTPIYGFPFESPPNPQVTAEPGISVHGGTSGTEDILAEEVETELDRVETDFDARITALEDAPPVWLPIDSGFASNVSSFAVTGIPVGTYSRIRVSIVGQLNAEGTVRIRVNEDDESGLHKSGFLVHDATDNLDDSLFTDATTWQLANWATASGNTAHCEMYRTDIESLISYEGGGGRPGGSSTTHRTTRSWGRLNSARLIDSFRVFAGASGATEFQNVRYQVEGRVV